MINLNRQLSYWSKHPDKFIELIGLELLPYQRIILKLLLKIEEKKNARNCRK